ncbi:MAG: methionyl-tRNA formyltransferase [Verrucomicrobia subdivision 3 bacterium]|nr:methionyl-tRNA formyltransferase [Limisphaerales bacterium]
MNIVFMGTAELACPSLDALASDNRFRVLAVVTQPDKPKGRQLKLQPSPVKKIALSKNLPVLQPPRARADDFIAQLRALQPELIIVAAYGQILPQPLLDIPPHGCLNVHASILPGYRGAAPIQWAVFNGDPETGVTIMKMDASLDTGDILAERRTPIADTDNAQTLHDRLAKMGAQLLLQTIPGYVSGQIKPRPQPSADASYARKITKEDGAIDWKRPARAIWNQMRAFTPWPGAYTYAAIGGSPRLLKIWAASPQEHASKTAGEIIDSGRFGILVACGEHALRILELQLEGGRRLAAQQFLAGHSLKPGDHFVDPPKASNS